MTEATGEVLSGIKARTASSRNSHGKRKKQVDARGHDALPAASQITGGAAQ